MQIISRPEARAAGLSRYYTGKPCKHGHLAERGVIKRACCECVDIANRAIRLTPEQRKAARANTKAWYGANKDAVAERARIWYLANKDSVRAQHKAYYSENKVKEAERKRVFRVANKEMMAARRKAYHEANPEIARTQSNNRRALKRAAEGKHTADEIKALFARQRGKCAICRFSLKGGYDADHIMPLKLGGSNWISNIQLLCEPCNASKGAKHPVDFMQRRGFLL